MPRVTKSETIGFSIGYALSMISSLVRLGHRLHRHQAWWDDLWAFIALCFLVFNVIIYLLLNIPDNVATLYPFRAGSFMVWISFQLQPAVIWASRLSIQVTVIRFLSPGRNRFISKCGFVALIVMWVVAAITKVFYCGVPVPPIPNCPVYNRMPSIVALILDVLSTAWLVGWPIYILARMRLPRSGRSLIVACFASSLLLGAVDIYHAVNLILNAMTRLNVSGHLEPMLAIVLCNLLVLVTYIYRIFRGPVGVGETGREDSDTSTDPDLSTSKRTTQARTRADVNVTGRQIEDLESSIGPLTTVYASTEDMSNGFFASISQQGSELTSPTSPVGSLSSKIEKESSVDPQKRTDVI